MILIGLIIGGTLMQHEHILRPPRYASSRAAKCPGSRRRRRTSEEASGRRRRSRRRRTRRERHGRRRRQTHRRHRPGDIGAAVTSSSSSSSSIATTRTSSSSSSRASSGRSDVGRGNKPRHSLGPYVARRVGGLVFIAGYALAVMEEQIGRGFKKVHSDHGERGAVWVLVASGIGIRDLQPGGGLVAVTTPDRFVEVFLFLLCAMTFINTMQQLNVFHKLRYWLVDSGFSYRSCFWITGLIAFWLSQSPITSPRGVDGRGRVEPGRERARVRRHVLREHRRRRQRRQCLLPLRRPHHPHGVAEQTSVGRLPELLVPSAVN